MLAKGRNPESRLPAKSASIGVSIAPGAMTFTRTPKEIFSSAAAWLIAVIAALLAP